MDHYPGVSLDRTHWNGVSLPVMAASVNRAAVGQHGMCASFRSERRNIFHHDRVSVSVIDGRALNWSEGLTISSSRGGFWRDTMGGTNSYISTHNDSTSWLEIRYSILSILWLSKYKIRVSYFISWLMGTDIAIWIDIFYGIRVCRFQLKTPVYKYFLLLPMICDPQVLRSTIC